MRGINPEVWETKFMAYIVDEFPVAQESQSVV
jgi:hypothetical protein